MENRLHCVWGNRLEWLVETAETREFCAAVIPCLNEAGTIGAVVGEALRHVKRVWVVDDGSSDRTKVEAERAGATVIRHELNLGKGASLRDGLAAARGAGFEFAAVLDGDGQHDAGEIPKLIGTAISNGADLVIGNRMQSCAAMTATRWWVNRWMSARLGRRIGMETPDSQCGFRLVRLEAWAKLELRQNRFETESEMLVAFARARFKVEFVPVKCLPAQRGSRIRPIADSARWLRWWMMTK